MTVRVGLALLAAVLLLTAGCRHRDCRDTDTRYQDCDRR